MSNDNRLALATRIDIADAVVLVGEDISRLEAVVSALVAEVRELRQERQRSPARPVSTVPSRAVRKADR